MRILYIFQDEYPWDVRVEKICSSLSAAHDVHVLCRNRGSLPAEEQLGALSVHRVGGAGPAAITGFPAFFSPWWISAGLSLIRNRKIDLLIVRDLPLCPLALILKSITGVPVVFDMAEDYPAMIEDTWRYRGPGVADYLIRNPRFLRAMENFVLPRVDETWVVSAASRARVMAKAGPGARVRVIGNTPTIDILDMQPATDHGGLAVVYTGFIDVTRGLDTVARAVALARKEQLPVTLDVVGTGEALEQIKGLVADLGIGDFVTFHGWRSQPELRAIIAASSIGVVPHRVTAHTNTTLPNKIFDYMALAKPVIVSNARALEDVVTDAGCGLVFRDGDPESLLACLRQLESAADRQRMGESGRRHVREQLNWSRDEVVLLAAVKGFSVTASLGSV
ncbi:MAG: glycosyltransferase family 4 protein [Gammaproteobacteria bacterium]|jgi:glycosyltransferase involved in cell wall biosynthesis|nr:glycosyltransferase family 4 protein [Gammaproteobacteria bacterium]